MTHRWAASIAPAAALSALTGLAWGQVAAPAPSRAGFKVIRAQVLREALDATSPEAVARRRAPITRVPLQAAFLDRPSIVGTPSTVALRARAIRTTDELYGRLARDGLTVDAAIDGTADLPRRRRRAVPAEREGGDRPVHGRRHQEVRALGVRVDQGWQVVISRRLISAADDGVPPGKVRQLPVAFAVWNGTNQERDGFEAVTLEWWTLRFRAGGRRAHHAGRAPEAGKQGRAAEVEGDAASVSTPAKGLDPPRGRRGRASRPHRQPTRRGCQCRWRWRLTYSARAKSLTSARPATNPAACAQNATPPTSPRAVSPPASCRTNQ